MLSYLWNFCKCALLKITALVWNAIKLVQGKQQQQLNTTAKGKVDMAVEVWTDVFSFVKRVELARSVSLTNWHIHDICWPRLHGNRVMAHEVELVVGWPWSTTAKMLVREGPMQEKEVPFANCPPPDYITRFRHIQIYFLDAQVLAFFKLIASRITGIDIGIGFDDFMEMGNLDEQKRGFINQLFEIFREGPIRISTTFANIPFLPDMGNNTQLNINADTDIPLLMNLLATPRPDGQQRVIGLIIWEPELTMEMVDAIEQDFRTSRHPLPQPFYITCINNFPDPPRHLNIPRNEEENSQTAETLTILPSRFPEERWWPIKICRHPKGEHGKWAEDAGERIEAVENGRVTCIDCS